MKYFFYDNKIKPLLIFLLVISFVYFLFLPNTLLAQIAEKNLLRIGISEDDAYPYTYKQAGKIVGLDIDLIKTIAHELNLQTQIVEIPFSKLGSALEQGNIDIVISLISETPERAKKYTLSDPYICTYGTFLFRNEAIKNNFESNNRNNKLQLNIGVKKNTRYHSYVLSVFSDKNFKVHSFNNHSLVFGAFETKKLDMILSEDVLIKNYANRHKAAMYTLGEHSFSEKLVIVAAKNNSALINKINQILLRMHNDGRLQSLSQKYLKTNLLCR